MAFTKITNADTANKGVVGLPDTPGLSATNMQKKFDELATDVIIPKHNSHIDELEATTAAASIGATATAHSVGQTTVQGVLNSLDSAITSEDASLKAYVDAKDNATNARIDAQYALIENAVSTATTAYNTANTAYSTATTAYNRATDAVATANDALTVANGARSYVDVAVTNLTNLIMTRTTIIDPITGQPEDIQTVINDIFDYMRPAPITAQQYDELGLTAEDYEAYGLTAYQYDMFAAQELL